MILHKFLVIVFMLFILASMTSCAQFKAQKSDIEDISAHRALMLNKAFTALLDKHKINTAGVAVIKNRKLVWQNQFGLQSPGVPANAATLFDVASLTKPVTAETILRLVAKGKLSLDESIAPYWVDSDLQGHPKIEQLTPRMLLTHTSGFMNWRYFSEDKKLGFINAPGTTFGYSGEGFEYLAKYAENKLGVPFGKLVESTLFEPLGMSNASFVVRKENFSRIAQQLIWWYRQGIMPSLSFHPCRARG